MRLLNTTCLSLLNKWSKLSVLSWPFGICLSCMVIILPHRPLLCFRLIHSKKRGQKTKWESKFKKIAKFHVGYQITENFNQNMNIVFVLKFSKLWDTRPQKVHQNLWKSMLDLYQTKWSFNRNLNMVITLKNCKSLLRY